MTRSSRPAALDWAARCSLARVRVLALRAQAAAGATATDAQLRRAIAPVLGALEGALRPCPRREPTVVASVDDAAASDAPW